LQVPEEYKARIHPLFQGCAVMLSKSEWCEKRIDRI
jgi:hypothetical protein